MSCLPFDTHPHPPFTSHFLTFISTHLYFFPPLNAANTTASDYDIFQDADFIAIFYFTEAIQCLEISIFPV